MIELYSRLMTKEEICFCENVIEKTQALRNANNKISLCKTLNNLNLRSSFSDKDKRFWNNLRMNHGLPRSFDLVLYNDSVFCVSDDCFKVVSLTKEKDQYVESEISYSAINRLSNWYCTVDNTDICSFNSFLNDISKANLKSDFLVRSYKNKETKQKQYYFKANCRV